MLAVYTSVKRASTEKIPLRKFSIASRTEKLNGLDQNLAGGSGCRKMCFVSMHSLSLEMEQKGLKAGAHEVENYLRSDRLAERKYAEAFPAETQWSKELRRFKIYAGDY